VVVPNLAEEVKLPMCFADGNAPYLIGREGFFDEFEIVLDKVGRRTIFRKKAARKH